MSVPKDYKYKDWLTEEEWALFETNYKLENSYVNDSIQTERSFLDFLERMQEKPFEEFISSAFLWDDAEQEENFWLEISNRTQPLNKEINDNEQ